MAHLCVAAHRLRNTALDTNMTSLLRDGPRGRITSMTLTPSVKQGDIVIFKHTIY